MSQIKSVNYQAKLGPSIYGHNDAVHLYTRDEDGLAQSFALPYGTVDELINLLVKVKAAIKTR